MREKPAVEQFYSRWAGLYDVLATRPPGITAVRERAVDALALTTGDTVVDVGCGTGANFGPLRERVGSTGRVVGLDRTPGMLIRARRRVLRNGWRNVHLVRGDATAPPIVDADAVIASFVVGMLDDPAGAVRGWTELVSPPGRVALVDAAPRSDRGLADAAFRLFVAATAPPTFKLRYPESPAAALGDRVDTSRAALFDGTDVVTDERFGRGFLRLTVGEAVGLGQ